MFTLIFGSLVALIGAAVSLLPARTFSLSEFELRRRAGASARAAHELEAYRADMTLHALRRLVLLILVIAGVASLVTQFGPWVGGLLAVVFALLAAGVSRLKWFQRIVTKQYLRYEQQLIVFSRKVAPFVAVFARHAVKPSQAPASKEELFHAIDASEGLLAPDDFALLRRAGNFSERQVKEVMTSVDDMVYVPHDEFLGPLVLSELHAAGHAFLPVTGKDSGDIVGILSLEAHTSLKEQRPIVAREAMSPQVVRVVLETRLIDAISTMLEQHVFLCMVEDSQGAIKGLVTLHDCVRALIGGQPKR